MSSRPAFLLPVRVLGKLFHRLFLTWLHALFDADRLAFRGQLAPLAARRAFMRYLPPVRSTRWVVYAKPPFAGPKAVLACLSRYTHCVAISNRRLLAFNENGVTFCYKNYRRDTAHQQQKIMTPTTDEFIRRFMLHVLPRASHRIRHYGLLASSSRKVSLARMQELLNVISTPTPEGPEAEPVTPPPCPYCGCPMTNIQILPRWCQP
uniref:IS91 family transposase n=1 Tax=Komagataeibacter europaeus TaxID=33995 RepID=UPI0038CD6560